jgi:galactokinase
MSLSPHLQRLVTAAEEDFGHRFGRPPRWIAAAPGRVNLIGEHTDYNDGFVLPMAIDRHVVIAADRDPSATTPVRVYSIAMQRWGLFSPAHPPSPPPADWDSYVHGVTAGFRALGHDPSPFAAVIHSDVPLGGGLSSSAALEVAMATLLEAMTGLRLDPLQKALLCQKAEHEYAHVPCGIMDQCSSVMGRAGMVLLLDCRARTVHHVPLTDPDVVALIVDSRVSRELAAGEYAIRRRQCEEATRALGVTSLRDVTLAQLDGHQDRLTEVLFRRARHVVTENQRTREAAAALQRGDWETVGRLMYSSHASLRDDYEVSSDGLDLLVQLAQQLGPDGGVIGARMTGGGFGGCIIALIRADRFENVTEALATSYYQKTGRSASLFATTPAEGARVIVG